MSKVRKQCFSQQKHLTERLPFQKCGKVKNNVVADAREPSHLRPLRIAEGLQSPKLTFHWARPGAENEGTPEAIIGHQHLGSRITCRSQRRLVRAFPVGLHASDGMLVCVPNLPGAL